MPWYDVKCRACGAPSRAMADPPGPRSPCAKCGGRLVRSGTGPGSRQVETVGTSHQRPIERLVDAERLHRERALNAPVGAGAALPTPGDSE